MTRTRLAVVIAIAIVFIALVWTLPDYPALRFVN